MNRRGFLTGVTAAVAAACLPKLPAPRRPRPLTAAPMTWTVAAEATGGWTTYVVTFTGSFPEDGVDTDSEGSSSTWSLVA